MENRRGSLTYGLWSMPGSPLPELEKGFCYSQSCARAVSSCLWAKDGRSRWREGWGGVSAGLVSAGGSAIHTTQMQVDEVTVIRLSPIVYNKELVKTVIESDTHPSPTQSKQYMRKRHTDRNNNKKKANKKHTAIQVGTYIYKNKNCMSLFLCIYTYMCTHTQIHHKHI